MLPPMSGPRFQFKIDPKTPLDDLLPAAPTGSRQARLLVDDDLAKVPEVAFQGPPALAKAHELTAHTIAKINHVNQKKTDAFMEALMKKRTDLAGLPFTLGEACRMKGERGTQFANSLTRLRGSMQQQIAIPIGEARHAPERAAQLFWQQFPTASLQEDQAQGQASREARENLVRARIAALMQVLAPETAALRRGLARYLSSISDAEATRALARLAIFSAEEEVRQEAIDALKVRRDKDYTDIMRQGLRYPWPAVARRASEAVVKLERKDLVPELVAMLDEPDPRAPVTRTVKDKSVPVVRELVRINHHRNCVLCHAPAAPGPNNGVPGGMPVQPAAPVNGPGMPGMFIAVNNPLSAEVPIPGQPLPTPSQGYGNSNQDILVRIDVTYLRQDFSLMQRVEGAQPWPEMQRFDFLVRNRTVTEGEANTIRQELNRLATDGQSPYQRAVHLALRELTGRDADVNASAWRRALDLPGARSLPN